MADLHDPLIEDTLRHLSRGWQGFLGILWRAIGAGYQPPPEEVERLGRMHTELGDIVARLQQKGQP